MKRKPLLPLVFIVALAAVGVITTLATNSRPLLGLDLQGGASVVLQPDRKVDPSVLDRTISIIRSRVDSLGVAEPDITRQGDSIVVALPGVDDPGRALSVVGRTAELRFRSVLSDVPSENEQKAQAILSKTSTTIAAAASGASSTTAKPGATTVKPTATTAAPSTTAAPALEPAPAGGFGQFAVAAQADTTAAPTTTSPAAPTTTAAATTTAAKATATTTAAESGASTTVKAGASTTVKPGATTTTVAPAPTTTIKNAFKPTADGGVETTPIDQDDKNANVVLPVDERSPDAARLLLGPSTLSGAVVKDAFASTDTSGFWRVQVELNSKGTAGFNQLAQANCGQRVAIVLDGVVQSAPVINQPCSFPTGQVEITGNFTEREARDLSTVLKFGSLPVQLTPQTVQTVSATLGKDSLNAGLITGLIGLALVCLYMLFYYRLLGFVVIAGLLVSAALMWSLVSMLSKTRGLALSLSGAVGIIVSVGVTVDSYVVYFERLRDEIRAGKTIQSAVDKGFRSAWRTILAADATSFIGALVLYLLTVGAVRGFAFFLMISTALDVFVAYMFTRPLVAWIASRKGFTGKSLGLDPSVVLKRTVASTSTGILRPAGASSEGAKQ